MLEVDGMAVVNRINMQEERLLALEDSCGGSCQRGIRILMRGLVKLGQVFLELTDEFRA